MENASDNWRREKNISLANSLHAPHPIVIIFLSLSLQQVTKNFFCLRNFTVSQRHAIKWFTIWSLNEVWQFSLWWWFTFRFWETSIKFTSLSGKTYLTADFSLSLPNTVLTLQSYFTNWIPNCHCEHEWWNWLKVTNTNIHIRQDK